MSSIEDNIADEIRKEKNTRSEGKSEGEEAPKKKNLAFVIRPQNSKNSSRIQGNVRLKSLRVHSRVRVKTRQRQRRRVRHHREHVRKSQVQKSHRLRGRFLLKL